MAQKTEGQNTPHAERKHSLVSASAAYRWLACPGSVALSQLVPPPPESEYAKEGTLAHELAELMLKVALHEKDLRAGLDYPSPDLWEPEMVEYVSGYVTFVWDEIQRRKPKRVLLEEKVLLDRDLDIGGTADVAFAYRDGKQIVGKVIDLKYGRGVKVIAEGNPQLACYSCALDATYGTGRGTPFDRVEVTIYQPRLDGGCVPDSTAVFDRAELDAWAEGLRAGAKLALEQIGQPPEQLSLAAGEHCRFCAARAVCRAHARMLDEKAALDFADDLPMPVAIPDVLTLNDRQVGRILEMAEQVRGFLAAVEAYARSRYLAGDPVAGWKVVEGPTRRKWGPNELLIGQTLEAFGIDPWRKTLRTITEVERELKKKKSGESLDGLTERTKPSLALVPESDGRPGYDRQLEAVKGFDVIDPDAV